MRLLLVEDDAILAAELQRGFQREGYAADIAATGLDAQHLGAEEPYDVVVLDLGLPDRPGLEVLRYWRDHGLSVPVLILTARDGWQDKVDGLKAGADDYLTKPFHFEELSARLQALIRRSKGQVKPLLESADFVLEQDSQSIRFHNGRLVPLTGTEYRLLRYFLLHPGRIMSKSELTEHVYAYDADKDSNVIEVYIARLRDKVGKNRIVTKRGQGYVYEGAQ